MGVCNQSAPRERSAKTPPSTRQLEQCERVLEKAEPDEVRPNRSRRSRLPRRSLGLAGVRRHVVGDLLDLVVGELALEGGHRPASRVDLRRDEIGPRLELVEVRADLAGGPRGGERVAGGAVGLEQLLAASGGGGRRGGVPVGAATAGDEREEYGGGSQTELHSATVPGVTRTLDQGRAGGAGPLTAAALPHGPAQQHEADRREDE